MIKYIGRLRQSCQMCSEYGDHMYLDDKKDMKEGFPEVQWEELRICEKCAIRETPKKLWGDTRRNTSRNAS